MNNDGKGYRVQRLRPTFSSPESFLSDWSCYGDSQNYGSILAHDQRSIVSNNTSNCISDISRDPSYDNGISFNMPRVKGTGSCNTSGNKTQEASTSSIYSESHGANQNEAITTQLIMTSLEQDSDDDDERSISCFSGVNNPFRTVNNNKTKYTTVAGSSYGGGSGGGGGNNGVARNRRRHCRSKSFTNSGRSNDARQQNTIKRSSSANLLQSFESVSEITNSDSKESTLYLI